MFLFCLYKFLELEIVADIVNKYMVGKKCQTLFRMAALFYGLLSNAWIYWYLYICVNTCYYILWFVTSIVIKDIQDGQYSGYVTLCNDYYELMHASITICVLQERNKKFPLGIEIHIFSLTVVFQVHNSQVLRIIRPSSDSVILIF